MSNFRLRYAHVAVLCLLGTVLLFLFQEDAEVSAVDSSIANRTIAAADITTSTDISTTGSTNHCPTFTAQIPRSKINETCQKILAASQETYMTSPHVNPKYQDIALNCTQLLRAIQSWTVPPLSLSMDVNNNYDDEEEDTTCYQPSPRLHRLASKLGPTGTERHNFLKVLGVGGSMTMGKGIDFSLGRNLRWPEKLQDILRKVHPESGIFFMVSNIAQGGANEAHWIANLHDIDMHRPDLILLDLSVNDKVKSSEIQQKQELIGKESNELLNKLIHLPNQPAVMTVEMFRVGGSNRYFGGEAVRYCSKDVVKLEQNMYHPNYDYCPQFWLPQEWRQDALQQNKVPMISFRDAVWPIYDDPPEKLPLYWNDGSHPNAPTHHIVATTVAFAIQFLVDFLDFFLTSQPPGADEDAVPDMFSEMQSELCGLDLLDDYQPNKLIKLEETDEEDTRINKIEDQVKAINQQEESLIQGDQWDFGTDSEPVDRLDRYGWIYEQSNANSNSQASIFRYKIKVVKQGKVVVTRLVSYDDRMAVAKVWFSAESENDNVFEGSPIWNITSWHEELSSYPEAKAIKVPKDFTKSSGLSWPADGTGNDSITLVLNLSVWANSSNSTIDKFKFLRIQTC